MATIAAHDATSREGHASVNQARDVHVSDQGLVHIGNNYGTTAQSELHRRQNKVLKNLSSVPYEDRKNVNPPRVPGTCEWFLAHPLYRQWREGSRPMLWVSAEPGCGKSVLSRFLIDEELLTEYDSDAPSEINICYFFFKDGIQDQRSLQDALRCILKQIFSKKRILLSHSVLDRFETESHLSANTLWRVLMQAVRHPESGRTVVLLDSVDECQEEGRHELYKLLETCSDIWPALKTSLFRLFFTSRPSTDVRNGLGSLPVIHLEGETAKEVDKIAEEIKLVVESEIEALRSRFAISPKHEKALRSRLLKIDNRTYLWAHLTLDLIRKDLLSGRRDVLTSHMEIPQTVEAAYDSMLSKSHSPSLAKLLLQIVLAATRPLSLAETAAVLAYSGDAQSDGVEATDTEAEYERRVRGLCGLFTIVGGKVSLLHQTVREFLLEPAETSSTVKHRPSLKWGYSISAQQSHRILAEACIDSLLSNQDLVTAPEDPIPWANRQVALWSYAALNWNFHARRSNFEDVAKMEKLCEGSATSRIGQPWFEHYYSQHAGGRYYIECVFTPIQIAAFCGNPSLVHHLLQVNDLGQVLSLFMAPRDGYAFGVSAISLAAQQGYTQIVKEILSYFPVRLRHLLQHHPLSFRDREQRTPLGSAALYGHAETVSILLQENADVHTQDEDGSTPLINAFCSGEQEVVDILIARYEIADMAGIARQLRQLLSQAIRNGKRRAVQGIVSSGRVDLNTNLHKDETMPGFALGVHKPGCFLALATYSGEPEMMRILLEGGSDVNHVDDSRMTPLHWAAFANSSYSIRLLIEWGCNVNATNVTGHTPMALARTLKTIIALLSHGATVPGLESWTHNQRLLALAALNEHQLPREVVLWLKASRFRTEDVATFDIIMACLMFSGQDHLLHNTTSNSRALNVRSLADGWFLIHFAAGFGNTATGSLKKLLVMGADLGCTNYAGESPLDVAVNLGNMESIVEILSWATFRPLTEKDTISLRRLPDKTLIEIQERAYQRSASELPH